MGLNCSHGAFDGAYSAFNRLRQEVCRAMSGSFPPHDSDKKLEDDFWYVGDGFSEETHPGLWEFLSHSDCDGEISAEMCVKVANDLEALLPGIEKNDDGGTGHIAASGGYGVVIRKFIDGCREAAKAGEPLTFG